MPSVLATLSQAARDPDLRRLQVVLAAFSITEHATWLALLVYAFGRGGVDEAGVVAVALLVPALVAAPLTAVAADRFRGDRVLLVGSVVLGTSCASSAVAMLLDAGVVTYILIGVSAVAVTIGRPTVSAVLPAATHVPAELTAANVVFGFLENSGLLLGPALAGAVIGVWSPGGVFVLCATLMAVSAVACAGIELDSSHLTLSSGLTPRQVWQDTVEGFAVVRRERGVRLVLLMIAIAGIGNGVCDVLFVTASDVLDLGGTDRAGILGAMFGLGSVAGSGVMLTLVGRARITPYYVFGVALVSLPLFVLIRAGSVPLASVLFAGMGLGGSIVMIASTTMVQRIAPSDVVGRTFGIVEGLRQGSTAIGSAAITLAVTAAGFTGGLVIVGVAMLLLLILRLRALLRLDRGARLPDSRIVELLVADRITGVLPAPAIERLAHAAVKVSIEAGVAVTVEGGDGDSYFIVDQGEVDVSVGGEHVRTLGAGDGFGEVALLQSIPRTATVVTRTPAQLVSVASSDFIEAVTGHPRSMASATRQSDVYVGLEGGDAAANAGGAQRSGRSTTVPALPPPAPTVIARRAVMVIPGPTAPVSDSEPVRAAGRQLAEPVPPPVAPPGPPPALAGSTTTWPHVVAANGRPIREPASSAAVTGRPTFDPPPLPLPVVTRRPLVWPPPTPDD